eukprot:5343049-Pyramimonas_sp.AAC.1
MVGMVQIDQIAARQQGLPGVWFAMCVFYATLLVLFSLRWYCREATEDPLGWAVRGVRRILSLIVGRRQLTAGAVKAE